MSCSELKLAQLPLRDDWRSCFLSSDAGETILGVDFIQASHRRRHVELTRGRVLSLEQIIEDEVGLGAVVWEAVCRLYSAAVGG